MCRVQLQLLSIPSFLSYGHLIVLLGLEICTLWFQFFGAVFASKGYPFKNILEFKHEIFTISLLHLTNLKTIPGHFKFGHF